MPPGVSEVPQVGRDVVLLGRFEAQMGEPEQLVLVAGGVLYPEGDHLSSPVPPATHIQMICERYGSLSAVLLNPEE